MILTRSPYFITGTELNAVSARLDLTIYTGDKLIGIKPITYSIQKTPINSDKNFIFEISELVEDFIEKTFDGNYSTQAVWVKYNLIFFDIDGISIKIETEILEAVSGYIYFEDNNQGANSTVLIGGNEINALSGNLFNLPIKTNSNAIIKLLDSNNNVLDTIILTGTSESSEIITYVTNDGGYNLKDYSTRIEADGYEYTDSNCTTAIFNSFILTDVSTIKVESNSNGIENINVEVLEVCKYSPRKVTFINKFGVLQDLFFMKKSVEDMRTKRETYKSNTINVSTGSYLTTRHNNIDYNIIANESLKLSSGFVSESKNDVFKQLLLSERVWVTIGTEVIPVNILTSSLEFKTVLNDKLIEYTIDFNKSYNTISNVR